MSESQPFSIGVWPNGQPEKLTVTADYLKEKGFTSTDEDSFEKEIQPGKVLIFKLSTCSVFVKNGDSEPAIVLESSPDIDHLEWFYRTITNSDL